MSKSALITGCGGQDGSFLADILLERGYEVFGMVRHRSGDSRSNIQHLRLNPAFELWRCDVTDPIALSRAILDIEPDYIYHEADQDNVGESFNTPAYSVEVTVKAVTNLLEIVKSIPAIRRPVVFLPSSATIFGDASVPQNENTPLNPQSPYAIGKAAVLHLGNLYRNVHGLKIVTGILYNHDSDRRNGSYFLHDVCRIAVECALETVENTGDRFSDLDREINIGEARKYMEVVVQLMEGKFNDNYVIGSTFRLPAEDWIRLAFAEVGLDYRHYLLKANPRHRPGNPETYVPDTSKLQSHLLHNLGILTNQTALVKSLITKYRKEH